MKVKDDNGRDPAAWQVSEAERIAALDPDA